MLIGIVGLNGSGKDTIAKYLCKNYGFVHEDFGREIRGELKLLGKNYLDRNEMISLANEYRTKFGHDYWARRLVKKHYSSENLVITSIRNPAEVDYLKTLGAVIIEIYADIQTRYDRTVLRVKNDSATHGDIVSFEDFKNKEDRELQNNDPAKQQLLQCISMADYRLDNNGSIVQLKSNAAYLFKRVDANIFNWGIVR